MPRGPSPSRPLYELAGRPAAAKLLLDLGTYHFRERLDDITCPTLIVWADTDRLIPVSSAAVYQREIPDARTVVYPDTGHLPMLERPDRFNADLRRFIDADRPAEVATLA